MLAVTGRRTTIIEALRRIVTDEVVRIDADLSDPACAFQLPKADKYVLAAGVIHCKRITGQSAAQIVASLSVNLVNVVRLCETILDTNPTARICVVGSESAFKGSFDQTYALAKSAVHRYVETRKVGSAQQLVAVAPHIILDSGMTRRRHDYPELVEEAEAGKKFTTPEEVASVIRFLLWEPTVINNVVFRLTPTC